MFFAFRNLILPAALLAGPAVFAEATGLWENTTDKSFHLQFQADKDTKGTLTIRDGGFTLATWDKNTEPGKTLEWPARRTFKLDYSSGLNNYAHFRVRVLDSQRRWVEFILDNPWRGAPTITQAGAADPVVESEGTGYKTEGLKGGFKLNNKGFWSVKHDGTSF